MVSENRNTHSVQQKPRKPIHFTPHEVALMAYWANELSPDFVRVVHPTFTQAFHRYYLERLAETESPEILPALVRALNLKPSRTGGFTWLPR